jgi:ABC-type glycerol-3-phosphate transport system permease component
MSTNTSNAPALALAPRWQMNYRTSARVKKALVMLVLIVLSLASLFPFYWMVSGSLKTEFEAFSSRRPSTRTSRPSKTSRV